MPSSDADAGAQAELDRIRLENETLSGVVGVVASGPDLAHILDRVVDLLTRATSCHACFVYLRSGEQLRLRAASAVYSHLVGRIAFGVDQGLAGWTMQHRQPAFIREGAIDDPRTVYVAELEEERFQSMVAVPIPSRSGESIGAIVLHTVAPREFDEGILNVLSRAASLVAGAIENARLYEQARERVLALTRLSGLGRDIAAVASRDELVAIASVGVRELLGGDVCRVYEIDRDGRPRRVASDPAPVDEVGGAGDEATAVLDLLERGEPETDAGRGALARALGLSEPPLAAAAISLMAAGERLGVLLATAREPWADDAPELMRSAAHQLALALEKIALIERLTEENLAHDLFDALVAGELDLASRRARAAGVNLDLPYVAVEVRPWEGGAGGPWMERSEGAELAIKRAAPGAICDTGPAVLRALIPAAREGPEAARRATAPLAEVAASQRVAIGASDARAGIEPAGDALREASDAARIVLALEDGGALLLYRDSGAYRYLIELLGDGGPRDHLRVAVERVASYDRERRSELLRTLDEYLDQGRSIALTARILTIHVNTLRQRLGRIESLSGISLAEEDLLALQLAVKLARARRVG